MIVRNESGINIEAERGGKIKMVCREFEAFFIKELLNFKISSGLSGSVYGDIVKTEMSKKIAESSGLGLAEFLIKNESKF